MASNKYYAGIVARGVAMGAADVVPGVSGGTIAFITGIYDTLIDSLKAFGPGALQVLWKEGPGPAWRYVNGSFLLALFSGIALSILTLANAIDYALTHHPVLLSAFFFGLILASAVLIYRQIPAADRGIVMVVPGVVFALAVSLIRPGELPVNYLTVFCSGAVAICAMILPGISGSFILLILGMYGPVIAAIKNLEFATLAVFALGCGTGLMLFVRLLSWLLHRHRHGLLQFLTGLLLGSLAIIWPWKAETPVIQGVNWHNVWPWHYQGSFSADLPLAILLALVGVAIIWVIERAALEH